MFFKHVLSLLALFLLAISGTSSTSISTPAAPIKIAASTTSPKKISTTATVAATTSPSRKSPAKSKPKPAPAALITVKTTSTPVVSEAVASPEIPSPLPAEKTQVQKIEEALHALINAERAKAGLSALSYDAELADMARLHSQDMLAQNYFDHTGLDGCSMSCRFKNIGYQYRAIGENIYMMRGYDDLSADAVAEHIVEGWMQSPGHRENILHADFATEGLGVAAEGDSIYATEDLALKR